MTKLYTILVAAIFALTAAGCGRKDDDKKADPATKTDPAQPEQPKVADPAGAATPVAKEVDEADEVVAELAPKVEEFFKTFIADVDAAGDDCTKLGPAATKVLQDNADLMARMASVNHALAADRWKNAHADLMREFGKRMQKVARCAGDDPGLMKAMMVMPKD